MTERDPRAELHDIARMVRAYVEWHVESGSTGAPRLAPGQRAAAPVARAQGGSPAAASAAPAPLAPLAAPAAAPVAATAAGDAPTKRTLEVIRAEVAGCQACELGKTRTNTVFSRGNPAAKLCFVGEAPGADEDEQGVPFVGRAGQLLDKMIGAMGLDPETDVYVCNIIKCRPPGNRRPTPEESAACIPYLHEQLAIVEPRVIVALGNTAVQTLLATSVGITKLRGQWKLYKGTTPVMPTYHPSYLLRPSGQLLQAKREAWEDLQEVMRELGLKVKPKAGSPPKND